MELCHVCGIGRIIQDSQSPEWLCSSCGAVVNKPEEYDLSQAYYPKGDEPRQPSPPDSVVGAKVRPKGGKVVRVGVEDPVTDSTGIKPSYDNINMYDLISDYIRPSFNLSEYICSEVKRLFSKCEKRNRKAFHLSEYVGACIYIAILQSDKKDRYGRRKYSDKYRYRKKYITSEEVAEKLNATLSIVRVNYIKYKDVRPSRITRCAEELAKELRLLKSSSSKIPIDPAIDAKYKNQVERVEDAMVHIITEKLQLRSPTAKTMPFDKVCRAFMTIANKIDKRNLLKTNNLLSNRGHLRAPNVIAAALIYKVFRNQVTIRKLRRATSCGDKSLQKVLRIIMCSTK